MGFWDAVASQAKHDRAMRKRQKANKKSGKVKSMKAARLRKQMRTGKRS